VEVERCGVLDGVIEEVRETVLGCEVWLFGVAMEADEIRVVLARASELHAKISEAIERALKSEFLQSASSRSSIDSIFSDGEEMNGFDRFDRGYGKVAGDGNVEARTLGLIRDALETLEEQLEALQVGCSSLLSACRLHAGVL